MSTNWSKSEVEVAVEDYFNMLRQELMGAKYNKTEHRRELMKRLSDRSHGSVELKHQNISAVLIEMGIPYIDGYKPRFNFQRTLLPSVIQTFLSDHPEFQEIFHRDSEVTPSVPTVEDFLTAMEQPPVPETEKRHGFNEAQALYNPAGINYLEREARNQSLGDAGEQFVINFERARLVHAGKDHLADKIEQTSVTVGPSAGFDIRSFDTGGSDRFIEAKTTKYGKSTPFFVTPNELNFSENSAASYFLYRVFNFRAGPRLYTLHGHLKDHCILEPAQYWARPR
jgi:hypothetical protein